MIFLQRIQMRDINAIEFIKSIGGNRETAKET